MRKIDNKKIWVGLIAILLLSIFWCNPNVAEAANRTGVLADNIILMPPPGTPGNGSFVYTSQQAAQANNAPSATINTTISNTVNGVLDYAQSNPNLTNATLGAAGTVLGGVGGGVVASQVASSIVATSSPELIYCFKWMEGFYIPGCLAEGSYMILYVSSWILWIAALFFDWTIQYSLTMRTIITGFAAIQYGWEIFRNFINLFFILILVYIAIATILQISGYGYKQLLGKLVIAAFLINFSMFFTEVIIDVSNIVTLTFYKQIMIDAQTVSSKNTNYTPGTGTAGGSTSGGSVGPTNQWLSFGIMNAMGLSSVWGAVGAGSGAATSPGTTATAATGVSSKDPATTAPGATLAADAGATATDPWTMIMIGLGGSVFVLILSFVFFAAAFMFIGRIIVLIMLIITSPVAFAAGVLPKTKTYADKWWKHLTANALFAPAYMAMMFITLKMVWGANSQDKIHGNLMSLFAKSNSGGIQAFFFFFLLCSMLVMCLVVAASFGTLGAKTAQSWGKSAGTWGKNFAKRRAFAPVSYVADRASKNKFLAKVSPILLSGADKLAQYKVGGSSYRSRVDADKKKYQATSELIKKAVTGELIRNKGETATAFKTRKENHEKEGKTAQKEYLGVGTKKDVNEGDNVSRWLSKGKQLARQELMDKELKSKNDVTKESVSKIQKSLHEDLKDLKDDIKDLDPAVQKDIMERFGKEKDHILNIADPKDLKRSEIAKLVEALTEPLKKIENDIKANAREMNRLNKEKAIPTKTGAEKEVIQQKIKDIKLKTDILNNDRKNTKKTLENIERKTSRWQQIDIAKGTTEAIEESKPKTP